MKVCTKCGEDKPLSEYGKRKDSKDGHRSDCKACVKARDKAYREANRDEIAAQKKAYYQENRENRLVWQKAYYQENRDEIIAEKKAYYQENRDEIIAEKKAYYAANRDEIAARKKAYKEANREKVAAYQKAYHAERYSNDPEYRAQFSAANTRRQRLLAAAKQEPYLREDIFERDGWVCQLCQEPIDPELRYPESGYASIDHILPISLGGDDTPANVQAAHLSCNLSKNNRVELEDQAMLTGVAG